MLSNKKLNLLAWCDSPLSITGFGVVAKNILNRIHGTGLFNVACIGINHLDEHMEKAFADRAKDVPYRVFIGQDIFSNGRGNYGVADPMGRMKLIHMIKNEPIDAVFLMRDLWDMVVPQMPGQEAFSSYLPLHIQLAKESGRNFRVLAHFPFEHQLQTSWKPILDQIDYGYTFTDCYLDDLKPWSKNIDWCPQGADSKIYKPLPSNGWGEALVFNGRHWVKEYIKNGMDFRVKKMRLPNQDAFVVVNVNRNQPRKDLLTTFKAFSLLKQKAAMSGKGLPVILWMQMRPDDSFGDIRQLCEQEGLIVDRDVFFPPYFNVGVGWTNEELNMLYNAADVFISTSVAEGFGLTPVEAGMAGCPVLVPAHTGFLQTIKHLGMPYVEIIPGGYEDPAIVSGSKVFKTNAHDLANKLFEHYLSPGKLNSIVNQNIKGFTQTFDWDNIFKKYWMPMLEVVHKDIVETPLRREANKKRFLYVCEEAFGDILGATKTLSVLKAKYPNTPIDFMCKPQYKDSVIGNPNIDRILEWDINKIFDYPVIEDRPFLLGSNVFYPHARIRHGAWAFNPIHLLDAQGEMLGLPGGEAFIQKEKFDLMLEDQIGDLNKDVLPIITVHTTSQGGKMLHPQKWAVLLHKISAAYPHLRFLAVGGPEDIVLDPLMIDFRYEPGTDKVLSYRKMAYLQSKAICHIGIDSGPAHCASVVGTPSFVFWGWTNFQTCKPQKYSINIVPHYLTVCPRMGPCHGIQPACGINQYDSRSAMMAPCITSLSIEPVFEILNEALSKNTSLNDVKNELKNKASKTKMIYTSPPAPLNPTFKKDK